MTHNGGAALPVAVGLLLIAVWRPSRLEATDFSGSGQLSATATDNRGLESDLLERRFSLGLLQELTPFVRIRVGYQFLDLRTNFDEGERFSRGTRQPQVELLYDRTSLSARLLYSEQTIENTPLAPSFDRRAFAANLSWRPSRGPGLRFGFRDDSNTADVSALGRDVRSRRLDLMADYQIGDVRTSYGFERLELESLSNQFRTEQSRHDLRLDASHGLWSNRFAVALSGRVSRVARTLEVGDAARIAEPIPAVAGLFAVDLSPEVGELEPDPTLIDGDLVTPARSGIDIGGANLYRNVGLDLGITRPASRLEIAVDTLSGTSVAWRVYRSRDNLFWEPVAGVAARFDPVLLSYVLSFPETEDRFFKAVNTSPNPVPNVLVTEIRALLDLAPGDVATGVESTDGELYRADLVASFRPSERLTGAVGFGLSNDEVVTEGLARRDFDETHAFARLSIGLARSLDLHLNYRLDDSQSLRGRVLSRTVDRRSASLAWSPLPTLEAVLSAARRRETDVDVPIQSLDSIRFGLVTQLLPDLRLVSDVDRSRLEDAFAGPGEGRQSWFWRESLEMQPLTSWNLSASFSLSSNTTLAGRPLLRRRMYQIWSTWNATAYLTLGGTWSLSDDGGRESVNQSFNLSYSPGTRLVVSAHYRGYESDLGGGTYTDSLSVSYRPYARLVFLASLSRSRLEESAGESAEITNLRAALRFSF